MDLISFVRNAIPVVLALFCGVIVFSIIGLLVGNTYFILINCFKRINNAVKKEIQIKKDNKKLLRERKSFIIHFQKQVHLLKDIKPIYSFTLYSGSFQ